MPQNQQNINEQDSFINNNPAKQQPYDSLFQQKSKVGQGANPTGFTDTTNIFQSNILWSFDNASHEVVSGESTSQEDQIKEKPGAEAIKNVQEAVEMIKENGSRSNKLKEQLSVQSRSDRKAKNSQSQTIQSSIRRQQKAQASTKTASLGQTNGSESKGDKRNANQKGKTP